MCVCVCVHVLCMHVSVCEVDGDRHHFPTGEWDMKRPGISAIAHPSSLKTATTHGVFVLEDVGGIWSKYKEGT